MILRDVLLSAAPVRRGCGRVLTWIAFIAWQPARIAEWADNRRRAVQCSCVDCGRDTLYEGF
jgi:hypothetical protein